MATSSRDFAICGTCDLLVRPASGFAAHCSSLEHLRRAEGNIVRCVVCKAYPHRNDWANHSQSRKHLQAAETQGLRPDIPFEIPASIPGYQKCHICETFVADGLLEKHKTQPCHLKRIRAREEVDAIRETLRRATADKEGVCVSQVDGVDFGVVNTSSAVQGVQSILRVTTAPGAYSLRFIRGKTRPASPLTSKTTCAFSFHRERAP